ncbi:MAG: hypothetical protein QF365_03050 [Candidatus Thalassarchaeaceae archaeon]|jgi:hypothetical protein|nr:hypothetical protein [Candidatus Thalassarchaeaceae archaeon]MDP6317970.1 hypothetical protein [Candidatus Thalassarchaeaceae archaeon]HJM30183.1 hypothetical protein [Candidatus Thalassarchaeaceae archaeon]HJN69998.1 hypothetical protein [Candidatus Thalassarchaeaceae archaeon]|tara:strand:- start:1013 stop:1186 length:174 start_codon:yes stop_codon:yes gene_type:complete
MFENWGKEELGLIIFNLIGISIAIWFLSSRLRSKLEEVERRKARRWKEDPTDSVEEE